MPSRWSKDNAKKNAEENKSEIALPLATIARTVQYLFVLVARARSVVRPAGARLYGDTARAQRHLVRVRVRGRVRGRCRVTKGLGSPRGHSPCAVAPFVACTRARS